MLLSYVNQNKKSKIFTNYSRVRKTTWGGAGTTLNRQRSVSCSEPIINEVSIEPTHDAKSRKNSGETTSGVISLGSECGGDGAVSPQDGILAGELFNLTGRIGTNYLTSQAIRAHQQHPVGVQN